MLSFIHNWFLELVLPRRCMNCRTRGAYLCADCLESLPVVLYSSGQIWSIYEYREPVIKKAIWHLKYKGVKEIGGAFGRKLDEELGRFLPKNFLIIPIPMSQTRLRERGQNHAAIIAQAFARSAGCETNFRGDLLQKIKDTSSQVSIRHRPERLRNLLGAFAVNDPVAVRGQTICLIDDVLTTGGTIAAAREVLLKAGAKRVLGLAVAHG